MEALPEIVHQRLRSFAFAGTGVLFTLVAVPLLVLWPLSPGTTAPFLDEPGQVLPGSVAELTDLTLGGLSQFILMHDDYSAVPYLG